MTDLVEFIGARLEEDEAVARAASADDGGIDDGVWVYDDEWGRVLTDDSSLYSNHDDIVHIARHDPARVLREVAAKRRLVEAADESSGLRDMVAELYVGGVILRALAAVYGDHPDYRAEWTIDT